jgi:hypothetical protein
MYIHAEREDHAAEFSFQNIDDLNSVGIEITPCCHW